MSMTTEKLYAGELRADFVVSRGKDQIVTEHSRLLLSLLVNIRWGGAFLLTVGAFLPTVELLCLQSLKALIRRTFPL